MKVIYLFLEDELRKLEELLEIELPMEFKRGCKSDLEGLLEKKFVYIDNDKVIVDPIISFILRQLSNCKSVEDVKDCRRYSCNKAIIDIRKKGNVFKMQVNEINKGEYDG